MREEKNNEFSRAVKKSNDIALWAPFSLFLVMKSTIKTLLLWFFMLFVVGGWKFTFHVSCVFMYAQKNERMNIKTWISTADSKGSSTPEHKIPFIKKLHEAGSRSFVIFREHENIHECAIRREGWNTGGNIWEIMQKQ